jgi:hypothetical protein
MPTHAHRSFLFIGEQLVNDFLAGVEAFQEQKIVQTGPGDLP